MMMAHCNTALRHTILCLYNIETQAHQARRRMWDIKYYVG